MLILHIVAGAFVLLCGLGALCSSKGQRLHRLSGNTFFLSMLLLGGTAMFLDDDPTMAVLAIYFTTTAWAIVMRKENTTGWLEIVAMIAIAVVSASLFYNATTSTSLNPTYRSIFYVYASIAGFAAILDVNMIIRGGLAGKHRLARHAWRICFALLGAVMSFTANTVEYWPDFINSWALVCLTIAVMFFWVIRILFTKWFDKKALLLSSSHE